MQIIKLVLLPLLELGVLLDVVFEVQVSEHELVVEELAGDGVFVAVGDEVGAEGPLLAGTPAGQDVRLVHYLLNQQICT
jgi:hypothetical protein